MAIFLSTVVDTTSVCMHADLDVAGSAAGAAHRLAAGPLPAVIPVSGRHLCLCRPAGPGGLGGSNSDWLHTPTPSLCDVAGSAGVYWAVPLLLLRWVLAEGQEVQLKDNDVQLRDIDVQLGVGNVLLLAL